MPGRFVAGALFFSGEFDHHGDRDGGELGMIAGEDKAVLPRRIASVPATIVAILIAISSVSSGAPGECE